MYWLNGMYVDEYTLKAENPGYIGHAHSKQTILYPVLGGGPIPEGTHCKPTTLYSEMDGGNVHYKSRTLYFEISRVCILQAENPVFCPG